MIGNQLLSPENFQRLKSNSIDNYIKIRSGANSVYSSVSTVDEENQNNNNPKNKKKCC